MRLPALARHWNSSSETFEEVSHGICIAQQMGVVVTVSVGSLAAHGGRTDQDSQSESGQAPSRYNFSRARPRCRAVSEAVEAQQLAVQIVPNNAEVAHIFVTNVSKKPLNVQLPTVFAARPVLAQFQVPGGQQQNNQTNTGFLQGGGQTPQIIGGATRGNTGNPGQQRPSADLQHPAR